MNIIEWVKQNKKTIIKVVVGLGVTIGGAIVVKTLIDNAAKNDVDEIEGDFTVEDIPVESTSEVE